MDGVLYVNLTPDGAWTWQLCIESLGIQVTSHFDYRKTRRSAVRRAGAVAKCLGVNIRHRHTKEYNK